MRPSWAGRYKRAVKALSRVTRVIAAWMPAGNVKSRPHPIESAAGRGQVGSHPLPGAICGKVKTVLLSVFGLFLISRPAWAWFNEGHEIVAIIAADDLTP